MIESFKPNSDVTILFENIAKLSAIRSVEEINDYIQNLYENSDLEIESIIRKTLMSFFKIKESGFLMKGKKSDLNIKVCFVNLIDKCFLEKKQDNKLLRNIFIFKNLQISDALMSHYRKTIKNLNKNPKFDIELYDYLRDTELLYKENLSKKNKKTI